MLNETPVRLQVILYRYYMEIKNIYTTEKGIYIFFNLKEVFSESNPLKESFQDPGDNL